MRIVTIFFIVIALSVVGFIVWLFIPVAKNAKVNQQHVVQNNYSNLFNESVDKALDAYYSMNESFVEWDSTAVEEKAISFQRALDSIRLEELPGKDAEIAKGYLQSAKADLEKIKEEKNLTAKRRALHSLTDHVVSFLHTIEYDKKVLYLQNCPMAFNDEEDGSWISNVPEIRNPYLGLHDPKYGKGMLKCGETKETLNFSKQK